MMISDKANFFGSDFTWACGIEDTFIPQARPGLRALDEYALTQHYEQWRTDFDLVAESGVQALRWSPGGSEWNDYYDIHNYSQTGLEAKAKLVGDFIVYRNLEAADGRLPRRAEAAAGVEAFNAASAPALTVPPLTATLDAGLRPKGVGRSQMPGRWVAQVALAAA